MNLLATHAQNGPAGEGGRRFSRLDELLAHYAGTAGGREAILAPDRPPVTYDELWHVVSKAARELRDLGIEPSDRVAVILPLGAEAAMAVLAVATAAVCVPLNPGFTADEWQRYLGDLQVAALVTRADMDSPARGVAHVIGIPVIDLSPQPGEGPAAFALLGSRSRSPHSGDVAPNGDSDAFILPTSGTTSRPKLVPLTHASVCASAHNAGAVLRLGPQDRLLNVLPFFHAHGLISGLLTALAAGSTVVCAPKFDPDAFFGWLTEFRPTWYTAVPSVHRALLSAAPRHAHSTRCSSLRVVRSASASLPPATLGELEQLFGVPVIETYGMTEAASQIAANPLERRKPGSVGRPAGAEIAITDRNGRRLRAGDRGEIVLRGPTITRGYDNDLAATKAAFRDGWFRTGDLGYLDRDGYLFIVGRIKDVIKRGGQQVAPAEVEETLLKHPDVVEAVVFAVPDARLGEDVAAAVVLRADAQASPQALRAFALERLAKFKVPGLIKIVPAIPKTAAGKVRRDGLAAAFSMASPAARSTGGEATPKPGSELEQQLARLWADLLEMERIGVDQDVFALGADSITVTQMLSRLRTHFGVDFSFNDMFDAPTIAALAARIAAAQRNPAIAALSLRDVPADARTARLSFHQQRIRVLSRLDPIGHTYHIVELVRLSGQLDAEALDASITAICQRHEVLRSTFADAGDEPSQTVGAARTRVERIDLRPCATSRRTAALQRQARALLSEPFDLENEPPLRAQLLQLDDDDHALLIKVHHLVTDGWSQRLFWDELETFYRAGAGDAAAALPALAVQYRQFAEWQRAWLATREAGDQLGYWRAQLDGVSELPLPTDRPRPERRTGRGARHPLKFSRRLSRAIRSLSREHRVTLFMTLLAAFQCLLHRYTQHEDVAVGSVIATRNQIEVENVIGMFANTIVLRSDLSGDPSFSEILQRVRQVTLDAYRNQDVPFEEVLRTLHASRSVDRNTLFQVMFILQNPPLRAPDLPGLAAQFVDVDPGTARVDLLLELFDAGEQLRGWFEYSTDLFDALTIERMAGHFEVLLAGIIADPEQRISRLPLLTAAERQRLLFDWSEGPAGSPRLGSFVARFATQATRRPNATAVSDGRARLSYRELARRSSAVADGLARAGVGPDVVVGLISRRGVDLVAAMIGVQQAGGAFLPLDPALPAARLATIIQHSRTPLVLASPGCAGAIKPALSATPRADRPKVLSQATLARAKSRKRSRAIRSVPAGLAYVVYTSGSTGAPKGVMIEQRGLMNHLVSRTSELGLSSVDVVAQTAPQTFDISIWQSLAALMAGARVHIVADEDVRDPARLAEAVRREGVTVLQVVPSLLRAILDPTLDDMAIRPLSGLRSMICIGEALAADLCHSWLRRFPGVPLINAYGPAECSDTVATHRVTASTLPAVPIGRAIANTRVYVLDAHMQPAPIGVAGELCVGGAGVGRGYLNDPDQTRRRFVPDPFSRRPGGRLYKTGDQARWRADGTLEFFGRVDNQVKVRGHRIELEEIEQALVAHPEVGAAAVLKQEDVAGQALLVACVAARGDAPDVNALRDFLKARLPDYMVPAGFVFVDRMPLTKHGKLDRAALGAGHKLTAGNSEFVAPRNATEEALAGIWTSLLTIERVGVRDNFFALGGHSLLAGRVMTRIADAFGVRLPLRVLFETPRIAELAAQVDAARATQSPEPAFEIPRLREDGPLPVSVVQEQVLKVEREIPGLPLFNLAFGHRLQGPLDVSALDASLVELVRRHDSLRTAFAWKDGRPVAHVAPAGDIDSCLVFEDLAAGTSSGNDRAKTLLVKKAALRAEQEALTPFDTGREPLFRARLLRLGPDDHVLLLIMHHVIVDGWSIGILMEEASNLYAAIVAGRRAQLPEPSLQFSDVACWQRRWCSSGAASRQVGLWRDHLRGASSIFPTIADAGRALLASSTASEPVHVPHDLTARLGALSRGEGASLFMTLLTGFKVLLLARSGREDLCIATAMANRSHPQTERVIGPLVNTTLIRTRINVDMSFQQALARVRRSVLETHARQDMPFDSLAERLADDEGLDPESLIQVFFVLQNASRPLRLPGVTVQSFVEPGGEGILPIDRTWLSLTLKETTSGLSGACNYKSELFETGAIRRWMADYRTILARAVANPKLLLGRLADH